MAQINTNYMSLNAQKNLAKNTDKLARTIERLSSGLRVNSARDDATGLASGMKIDAAARLTAVEMRQQGDVISAAQIADGALAVVGDIMARVIELNKMGGGSVEIGKLTAQAATIQTEANAAIAAFGGTAFTAVTVTGSESLASALSAVSDQRVQHGATMNNAEFSIQAKRAAIENQNAARSRIMDTDFAEETSKLSRFQVLQQAGMAMVSQANQNPQNVLGLLR